MTRDPVVQPRKQIVVEVPGSVDGFERYLVAREFVTDP